MERQDGDYLLSQARNSSVQILEPTNDIVHKSSNKIEIERTAEYTGPTEAAADAATGSVFGANTIACMAKVLECSNCHKPEALYESFPCRCVVFCKKCAMKMATGGKCRKCHRLYATMALAGPQPTYESEAEEEDSP